MVCSSEAYTYEDPSRKADEAFRADSRHFIEEVHVSYLTASQEALAGCLAYARMEESGTGVASPRFKVIHQTAIADLLVGVESAFGLNVTELAKCMKASRQGIYDWRRYRTPATRSEHRERAERLSSLAKRWWDEVGLPLSRHLRNRPVDGGRTLADILSRDDISGSEVDRALDVLIALALEEKGRMPEFSPGGLRGRELADLLEEANG